MTIFLSLLGGFIGGALAGIEGLFIGLFSGFIFGMIASLKDRLFKLEQDVAAVKNMLHHSDIKQDKNVTPTKPIAIADAEQAIKTNKVKKTPLVDQPAYAKTVSAPSQAKAVKPQSNWQENKAPTPIENDLVDKLITTVQDFFTKGNVVVKVGVIVLFFGIAFLLKYAANRSLLPIEIRLAGVMVVGIAMLVLGWRMRTEKLEYGLILQGAGIGLLYITVYAATKLYHLLPTSITFVLMLLLVLLSGILAVQQNAKSLAIFGAMGGFLAPILLSTGSGNHVTLFSYYALLNVGVLGLAWFKSWRLLNFVGFVFTFVISGVWGYQAYQPAYFATTEPFLILFYFFYLTISVLFAFKQAPRFKDYVDGTLVFGLPLVTFALQSRLVDQFQYGEAISAVALACVYLVLSKLLWLPEKKGVRLLAESFLALGVTFASLAVPLAFDGRWTAAVWSLEGAALVWIGLRQSHIAPRAFGLLLSVGAGMAFMYAVHEPMPNSTPILNSPFIGMLLVSLSGFFIAYLYEKNQDKCYPIELPLCMIMVVWGSLWWFAAGVVEIDRHVAALYQIKAIVLFVGLTTFVQLWLSNKLSWPNIALSSILLTPFIALALLASYITSPGNNPLSYLGYLSWPIALTVHFFALRKQEQTWSEWLVNLWHAASVAIVTFITVWAIADWVGNIEVLSNTWTISVIGLLLTALSWGLMRWGKLVAWPINQFKLAYYLLGLLPVMMSLVLWQLFSLGKTAAPDPLAYVPLLNPLDIAQGFAILVLASWLNFIRQTDEQKWLSIPSSSIYAVLSVGGFIWINTILARSVHFFGGVYYSPQALMSSTLFQSATSIVWSLLALSLMVLASRKLSRLFWFAGAGLLALVVVKLFFVDLAGNGSIARIVSFLGVGAFMLIIGYFSPLPPKIETTEEAS